MTLLADIEWTCKCGHKNEAQLWHTDPEKNGEQYANDIVPSDCGLNWAEPCSSCGKYTLSDEEHVTGAGVIGWDVVPLDKDD